MCYKAKISLRERDAHFVARKMQCRADVRITRIIYMRVDGATASGIIARIIPARRFSEC